MFDFDEIENAQAKYLASKAAAGAGAAKAGATDEALPKKPVQTPQTSVQSAETVTVWIDPQSPELAITLQVPEGCATVGWVRQELCRQDPTGQVVLEHIRLGVVASQGGAAPLDDDTVLTVALGDLIVLEHGQKAPRIDGADSSTEAGKTEMKAEEERRSSVNMDGPEERQKAQNSPKSEQMPTGHVGDHGGGGGRKEDLGGHRPSKNIIPPVVAVSSSLNQTTTLAGDLARLTDAVVKAEEAGRTEAMMEALIARSEFYRQQGEAENALTDAEQCLNLCTIADARVLFLCGKARLEAGGKPQEALAELRRAKRLDPALPGFNAWILRAEHWSGSTKARPNHYKALGLPADAPAEQIRKAHRRMALIWHPDKPTGDASKFRAVQEAWEVLGDEKRRASYDFGGRKPAPDRSRASNGAPQARRAAPVPSPQGPQGDDDDDFSWHFEYNLGGPQGSGGAAAPHTGAYFCKVGEYLQQPSQDLGPVRWVWTKDGVRNYAEKAEAFGHPREGDPFTPAHLATMQEVQGFDYGGYSKLVRMGIIRREGKNYNSLDPPPGGYKEHPGWTPRPPGHFVAGISAWPGMSPGDWMGRTAGQKAWVGTPAGAFTGAAAPARERSAAEGARSAKGDGMGTCLHCGFAAKSNREKGKHEREAGHQGGFFMGG